jgi:VanZ family protein
MALIFWMSSQARFEILRRSPDYVLHFIGYFGMGLLAVRAFARGLREPRTKFWGYLGLLFAFGYALTDEWHQSYVPGRVASGRDLVADGMGIAAAWIVLLFFWRWLRRIDARSTAMSVE